MHIRRDDSSTWLGYIALLHDHFPMHTRRLLVG